MVKKQINAEEINLFLKSVKGVRLLSHDKYCLRPQKKNSFYSHKKHLPQVGKYLYTLVSSEDQIQYYTTGLQNKLIRRLKSGKVRIGATIDLHRQTIEATASLVSNFVSDCSAKNKRWIRIIHGKGLTNDKPILKSFLNNWLPSNPNVLAFHSAPQNRGGTGALIVLLRQSRVIKK